MTAEKWVCNQELHVNLNEKDYLLISISAKIQFEIVFYLVYNKKFVKKSDH